MSDNCQLTLSPNIWAKLYKLAEQQNRSMDEVLNDLVLKASGHVPNTKVWRFNNINLVHADNKPIIAVTSQKLKMFRTVTYHNITHLLELEAGNLHIDNVRNLYEGNNDKAYIPLCGVTNKYKGNIREDMPWEGNIITCRKCLKIINNWIKG